MINNLYFKLLIFIIFAIALYLTSLIPSIDASSNSISASVFHGNIKLWKNITLKKDINHNLKLDSAMNEWEPFQLFIRANENVDNVSVSVSDFINKEGDMLNPPTIYRQSYINVKSTSNKKYGHTGLVPDALVPLINPISKEYTSGLYGGALYDLHEGESEAFWFDFFIDKKNTPGTYSGNAIVSINGENKISLPVKIEVHNFTLPDKKQFKACFQMDIDSIAKHHKKDIATARKQGLAHAYEEMLHSHYINNWSPIQGWDYNRYGVDIKVVNNEVVIDWSVYDKLVTPYMNGEAFKDGVSSQCLYVPYWMPIRDKQGKISDEKITASNYNNIDHDLLGSYFKQLAEHFKKNGWLDRAFVFYFDEPFLSPWKYEAFYNVSQTIRRHSPEFKILVTDGLTTTNKPANNISKIDELVDVWNPVTHQVSSPEHVKYYRNRKSNGHFDIWCQTLANANPNNGVINLFPEYDMPFHRMWAFLSWSFGFQGIEWWQTVYYDKNDQNYDSWTNPVAFKGFKQPLNGDGRLFYPGTVVSVGGKYEIPVSSLRMKALRESIEDYEYLYLLNKLDILNEFDLDIFHTLDKKNINHMNKPMPMGKGAWHWWNADPDLIMSFKSDASKAIVKNKAL